MQFKKNVITESLKLEASEKKYFSEKPQNIVITEEQFERLIGTISSEK